MVWASAPEAAEVLSQSGLRSGMLASRDASPVPWGLSSSVLGDFCQSSYPLACLEARLTCRTDGHIAWLCSRRCSSRANLDPAPSGMRFSGNRLRSCLETRGSSQSVGHQLDHCRIYPGFAGRHQAFVILAETTREVESDEGSLDHPSAGQQDELAGFLGAQDDRQDELEATGDPVDQASAVSAIDPDLAPLLARTGQVA